MLRARLTSAYLGDRVGLAVVDDRGGLGAVGGEAGYDLGGVLDGGIAVGVGASHEGGGGSDDGGVTHF